MSIAVVDVETTGLLPESASVVELAVVMLPGFESFSCLVKPEHEVEIQARAAHHITDEMLVNSASFEDAILASMIKQSDFIAAHNAQFDMGFIKIEKPTICTYRCARHLWPDAPSYSNQVLRYWLKIEDQLHNGDGARIMQLPPHRALPDALVTAHILYKMLLDHKPEALVKLTQEPILMKDCRFGKHAGKLWSEVPKDYMAWILRQKDFDSDTVHTAKHHLGLV